ncbi:DUF1801 domain-containing protein [Ruoffia tabacinasalis]|uniref:DUF1801 domain-containing protein n=1 Tax=Ruoffia tabacinasalis TaxID=87458 RepID=A0ABS0LJQ3_9LACT|nr:DUF1801 domain-containing protein [Ruoffia tabacinasalis]MBG9978510.1 DUF1801 domain-containing protein [Ruoffia tabacinasalis]HJG47466.1 DUF1801 domain-containing protein [Ruoffia tabacinasalis]
MSAAKFKPTGEDVVEFIESIDSKQKQIDSFVLLDLFKEVTGFEPQMWYPNIIGFGTYHYVYDSGREGDTSYLAFSPRKAKFSLYLATDFKDKEKLLAQLGKHTTGKMCIYVNKLADIDLDVLKTMLENSMEHTLSKYPK